MGNCIEAGDGFHANGETPWIGAPVVAWLKTNSDMPEATRRNVTEVAEPRMPLEIRTAKVADAAGIWRLVRDCDVLDKNSPYAYLLLCRDFSDTTLVAVDRQMPTVVGFVAAYIPPSRPDVIFVWQIGAAASVRRQGIGKSLLQALLKTAACRRIRFLEATVTPSNTASARLFRAIADELKTGFQRLPGFASSDFGPPEDVHDQHEPEDLVRVGPFKERA